MEDRLNEKWKKVELKDAKDIFANVPVSYYQRELGEIKTYNAHVFIAYYDNSDALRDKEHGWVFITDTVLRVFQNRNIALIEKSNFYICFCVKMDDYDQSLTDLIESDTISSMKYVFYNMSNEDKVRDLIERMIFSVELPEGVNSKEIESERVFLQAIELENFRGYAGNIKISLCEKSSHASFTLIYGRNGSGKTTIFDGLEYFFTGKVDRIEDASENGSITGPVYHHIDHKNEQASVTLIFEVPKTGEPAVKLTSKRIVPSIRNSSQNDIGPGITVSMPAFCKSESLLRSSILAYNQLTDYMFARNIKERLAMLNELIPELNDKIDKIVKIEKEIDRYRKKQGGHEKDDSNTKRQSYALTEEDSKTERQIIDSFANYGLTDINPLDIYYFYRGVEERLKQLLIIEKQMIDNVRQSQNVGISEVNTDKIESLNETDLATRKKYNKGKQSLSNRDIRQEYLQGEKNKILVGMIRNLRNLETDKARRVQRSQCEPYSYDIDKQTDRKDKTIRDDNVSDGFVFLNQLYDVISTQFEANPVLCLKYDRIIVVDEIESIANNQIHRNLMNQLYQRIEPRRGLKSIRYNLEFNEDDKPGISIEERAENDRHILRPEWHLSTATMNSVIISMFLSGILTNEKTDLKALFMDEPIAYFDEINILAFLDLMRGIIENSCIQIVMSTYNERVFNSHYIRLPIADEVL